MCGVWAQIKKNLQIDHAAICHAVEQLSHRGPDDYSWFADASVALVHTRLSIIDLAGGRQPLTSFDRNWIGVVNGELYDFHHHRKDLEARGVTFQTKSDSEVLLNLFALDGAEALSRVSGEYSFVFYHRGSKKIVFGRDLSGVKPLFFRRDAEGFEIGSEMKAMVRGTPQINPRYIENLLARVMLPPETAIEGIEHALPGRLYTLDTRTFELDSRVYRALPLFGERTRNGSDSLPDIEDVLRNSVRKRLVADVPVGLYLSGGIDSSLLAAIAAECGVRPQAFTVTFADKELDESEPATAVAKHLGLEQHVVEFGPNNFFDSLTQSIVAFENPITNPHGAAKNLLASEARKHVKVVLTGEGADEIFGGYPYFREWKAKRLLQRHPTWKDAIQKLAMEDLGEIERLHLSNFEDNLPHLEMFDRIGASSFLTPVLGRTREDFLARANATVDRLLRMEFPGVANMNSPEHSWDRLQFASFRLDLLHYILANVGDRQEMAHSIEGRTPFLDPDLIELACRIKPDHMIRGTQEKSLLKRMARKKLPPEIWQRKKQAFFAPLKYLFRKPVREAIADYAVLCRRHIPELPWARIDAFVDEVNWNGTHPQADNFVLIQLVLLSTGILIENLGRSAPSPHVRYTLPKSAKDLEAHRSEGAPASAHSTARGFFDLRPEPI